MARKLLVIDDDPTSRRLMFSLFEDTFEVHTAADGRSALAAAVAFAPDVIALDIELPDASGLDLLVELRARLPDSPVIMMTADHELRTAVQATKLGAYDYLTKPIDTDGVAHVFARALEARDLKREVFRLRQRAERVTLAAQMGPSSAIAELADQVDTVAASDFSVLLLGETGTGKEVVAQAIHRASARAAKPLVAVDCGAIPETLLESELFGYEKGAFSGADRRKEGQFQLAEGGTILLDEIGNLPLALQPKLLRALESRQVNAVGATRSTEMDVRFVAATNADLQAKVAAGEFRADLFFRLAQYTIILPPLRERATDIVHLAQRFLVEVGVELRRPVLGFAPAARELLVHRRWPGNVRELRNVVRQAVLRSRGPEIDAELVGKLVGSIEEQEPTPEIELGERSLKDIADAAAREAERAAIRAALRAAHGNKTHAARLLKTDFKTLHVKMKQLAIDVHEP